MNEGKVNDEVIESACLDVNRYEVEESAIFIDFSKEAIQLSHENYKTLNIYERGSLAKNIDSIRTLFSQQKTYYDLLELLAADNEDIQREILSFLRGLHSQRLSINVHSQFVTPIIKIITGTSLQLKEAACVFMEEVLQQMDVNDRKQVLELAFQLEKKTDEESKIAGMQLVSRLSKDMTQAEISEAFALFFRQPYKNASVRLKKEIMHNIGHFGRGATQQFLNFQIIGQFFSEKCKEPVWGIRKACVDALPQLVNLTKTKKQILLGILMNFTRDGSKIVRLTAFKCIPQFAARYDSPTLPQSLLDLYCGLINNPINKEANRENQIIQKVAFYFPGVVHVCGATRWQPLRELMLRLLGMKSQDVKLPVASSLHDISKIIGPALASHTMFPVVDRLLKQESQILNLAVISHFASFVGVFDTHIRQSLIDFFLVLQNDPKKWRVRYQIAKQIGMLSKSYTSDQNFQYFFPITLKLCSDSRSLVREEAAQHMRQVIQAINENKQFQEMAVESIVYLGYSTVYLQRQILAFMVTDMSKMQLFRIKMKEMLILLSKDKVVGVKTMLAHSLLKCEKYEEWTHTVQQVSKLLMEDQDDSIKSQFTTYD